MLRHHEQENYKCVFSTSRYHLTAARLNTKLHLM